MEKLAKGSIDINDLMDYYNNKDENKKHLKGYMYDSLVYRYQMALYKAVLYDHRGDRLSPEEFNRYYNRELMRFCQILDEAIGEHD